LVLGWACQRRMDWWGFTFLTKNQITWLSNPCEHFSNTSAPKVILVRWKSSRSMERL